MQVKLFSTPIQNFKGSFKIEDLEAFVQDFEEDVEVDIKPKKLEIQKDLSKPSGLITKNTGCVDKDGAITAVIMFPAIQGKVKSILLPTIANLCKKHDVNPDSDLFMVSGLDALQRRYIMFNSFYKDKKTGTNCVQVFYTSSEDENLTNVQKSIIKLFNDKRNRYYLAEGSIKNPFAKASEHGVFLSEVFSPVISAFNSVSKEMPEDEMIDENGKVNPVIYSQTPNGIYTRYKVITLYK